MPKKRNEPSPIEIVIASRWPVAATLAAVCFVAFLILPGILASNRFLFALAPLIRTIALIGCLGFGVVSLFKFLREAGADRTAARVTSDLSAVRPARQRSRDRYPGASAPAEWSLALLQSIEWKRFEEVIAAYFRAKHFRCETIEYGADGASTGACTSATCPRRSASSNARRGATDRSASRRCANCWA